MLAANYTNFRKNLKAYCDKVHDEDEVLLVTRKGEKHLVVLSLEHYNRLEKAARAAMPEKAGDLQDFTEPVRIMVPKE